jgi:hypothetical protein
VFGREAKVLSDHQVAPKQPSGLPWGIPPAFYALFGLLDEQRLKKAGHSSKYMPLLDNVPNLSHFRE